MTPALSSASIDNAAVRAGRVSRVLPAVMAMLLGAFIVGVTGFSHIEAVHNAAHDTRHASGFPCH